MQQQAQSLVEVEEVKQHLHYQLSQMRNQFKKKMLMQDHLGELAIQELLSSHISAQDYSFNNVQVPPFRSQLNISGSVGCRSITQDHANTLPLRDSTMREASTSQLRQVILEFISYWQEVKEGFEKAFDDMVNSAYKTKLLTCHSFTHIGIGFTITGLKGDVFRIATLVSKKPIGIEGFVRCTNPAESGTIIAGRVLDPIYKPCLVVINRGRQDQIIIGPNKMAYVPEEGVLFKVCLPDSYTGYANNVSSMFSANSQNLVEVLLTSINDTSFVYGAGQDISQTLVPQNNFELGVCELVPSIDLMRERKISVSQAMRTKDFLETGVSQSRSISRGPATSINRMATSASRPASNCVKQSSASLAGIKKTRSQLLREQNSAALKVSQMPPPQTSVPIMWPSSSNQNINKWNTCTTSSLEGETTMQKQQQLTQSKGWPTHSNSLSKNRFALGNVSNENIDPNQHLNKMQLGPGLQQPFQSKIGFQPVKNNNFQQPSNPLKTPLKFEIQFTEAHKQQQLQQPCNIFKPQTNNLPQPQFQFPQIQQQQPFQAQSQHQVPPVYNPNQQLNFNNNQPIQGQPQPISQFQPTQPSHPEQPMQQQQQDNQIQRPLARLKSKNQQIPVQSVTPHQPQPALFQQPQQDQFFSQQQKQLIFSQLSQIDQELLRGYLHEVQQICTPEQKEQMTQMMIDEPLKFFNHVKKAHEVFQRESQHTQSQEEAKKQVKRTARVSDFDDLSLFLMIMPESMKKGYDEAKYNAVMTLLEEGACTPYEALKKILPKSLSHSLQSYKELYGSKDRCDLVLILRNEEFYCHQLVFISNSDYFKKVLKKNEEINRYQLGIESPFKQSLLIPDWVDREALKLFIKFLYTGKISDAQSQKPTATECLKLLRLANFFHLDFLQERLMIEAIIPPMNPSSSLLFLKECVMPQSNHKDNPKYAWNLLKEYCYFYVSKHLPVVLRQDQVSLLCFDIDVLRTIIEKSLYFLVDGVSDLEPILKFTAEIWGNRDIYEVLKRCQYRFEHCSAFDYQVIPKMAIFFRDMDNKIPYQCQLTTGQETTRETQSELKKTGTVETSKSSDLLNASFVPKKDERVTLNDIFGESRFDLNSWKPSCNYLRDKEGKRDITLSKEPQFQIVLNLEAMKDQISKNKGATVISQGFDFGRRSWHLKVDVTEDENVSLWIMERGQPTNQSDKLQIGGNLPLHFSSILLEFELQDAVIGDRRTPLFFSFAHDSNQIIGHRNFINLSQLQNKGQLNLKVHMKEFILHSALIHYLSHDFYHLYKREFSDAKQQIKPSLFNIERPVKGGLSNLPFYLIYQVLSSHYLKVDEEDAVLGFIFNYIKNFSESNPSAVIFATDMLIQTLRFSYVSLYKIMSAFRDNECFRKSSLFVAKVKEEVKQRVSSTSSSLMLNTNQSSKPSLDTLRKFYDPLKLQEAGRKKFEGLTSSKSAQMVLFEEVINWAVSSRHQKHLPIDQETQRLKDQLAEERRRVISLQNEMSSMKYQFERIFNQYRQHQQQLPSSRQRLNNSWDRQREKCQVDYQQRPRKSRSPREVPSFLKDSFHINGNKNQFDNSFCSLFNFNDSMRVNGYDSTRKADKKLQENMQTDLSAVMNQASKNPSKVVPYYKQHQNGNDCCIF